MAVATTSAGIPASSYESKRDGHELRVLFQKPCAEIGILSEDMVIGFLDEDGEGFNESYGSNYTESESLDDEAKDREGENGDGVEEDKKFWENQHQLLQATLCRTSSLETRIRNATKEAIKELKNSGTACGCGRSMASCRKCLMNEISGRLRNQVYNSSICKSKWRSSPDIPSGEHTFLDVVETNSRSSKKGETRVIIELNFRAEFEMARASEEYNRLVQRLPEVFVGKVERLQGLIKILCSAAKKCMNENKMHMGPWRKQKYVQAKWLGPCEKIMTASATSFSMGHSSGAGRLPKPRQASMLTVDLLEMMPNMRCQAVEVV
ncbi:hypothetical protein FEM48_Zijuj01G0154300 [Ziziphus jujuba var. spinosa]|uniref:Uncharacterized protein n=1 Tax=Ziziphus jujuba var. spinosa TaxID=714518 RepID=A0A978W214_ZIZJJ|nr:hypothetical protein FEM48_Zijuj01G0154300 [Ziziphus jujuba var. spinosa]